MTNPHDLGGRINWDPIDRTDHRLADWEWQTHALVRVLINSEIITTDELRRGIEALPEQEYNSLSYYERWSESLESILAEKGILTRKDIDQASARIEKQWGQVPP